MQIKENTFIKLSDNRTYIVANILEFKGTEYAYLVSSENKKLYYSFCTETINAEGKPVLNSVKDKYLTERLKAMFSENMQEKLKNLKLEDVE
ncbi:MAG: hypothetical protein E7361_01055 [Clostridiales bacterium]|nr:hypothetical protein [Clostridiales bacterium]